MANYHVYFGIENLGLNNSQRAQLLQALNALGGGDGTKPAELNHWRTRLDNNARIYEALFNEDNISIQAIKNRLGIIFGINPLLILNSVDIVTWALLQTIVVTFSYPLITNQRVRMTIFAYDGLTWPTWEQSRVECVQYLINNITDWEIEEVI